MDDAIAQPPGLRALDIPAGKLGMWVFLISEIMFFTGLIGSYLVLRLGSESWPQPRTTLNLPLLGINTLVLLTSSLTMALGLHAIQQGRTASMRRWLVLTAGLGLLFLAIKGVDYRHMWHHGFTMSSNLFGSCYYLLTGFHALHVLSGVMVLLALAASRHVAQATIAGRVEYGGLYWHFIDVVWVVLFALLCLV